MSDPTDAQRHLRRASRLARQASAELAKAADAADPAEPVAATSRVVATFAVTPYEDAAVLTRKIHQATQTHGALDVLLVTDTNHHGPERGAQEEQDHGDTRVQRHREAGDSERVGRDDRGR